MLATVSFLRRGPAHRSLLAVPFSWRTTGLARDAYNLVQSFFRGVQGQRIGLFVASFTFARLTGPWIAALNSVSSMGAAHRAVATARYLARVSGVAGGRGLSRFGVPVTPCNSRAANWHKLTVNQRHATRSIGQGEYKAYLRRDQHDHCRRSTLASLGGQVLMSKVMFTIVLIGGTLMIFMWAIKNAIDHSFYLASRASGEERCSCGAFR